MAFASTSLIDRRKRHETTRKEDRHIRDRDRPATSPIAFLSRVTELTVAKAAEHGDAKAEVLLGQMRGAKRAMRPRHRESWSAGRRKVRR